MELDNECVSLALQAPVQVILTIKATRVLLPSSVSMYNIFISITISTEGSFILVLLNSKSAFMLEK